MYRSLFEDGVCRLCLAHTPGDYQSVERLRDSKRNSVVREEMRAAAASGYQGLVAELERVRFSKRCRSLFQVGPYTNRD